MTTIYQIAKKAGVSIATISRVINLEMRHKVSEDTLKKVDRLIQKHGYAPNLAAKNLSKKTFKTIGVLLPHLPGIFFSDYYSKILSGASDALMDTHYAFKMILSKAGMPVWDHYNFKASEGIDGLLVTQWPLYFSDKWALEHVQVPSTFITDPPNQIKANFISADNEMGGEMAARYLHSKGHRKMAVVTGPKWSSDSNLRLRGFKRYCEKVGVRLEPGSVLCGDYKKDTAAAVVENYLKKKPRITAIFCLNDFMAAGVLEKLKSLGVACPGEISVMGYDDERGSRYTDPPLTTISVPLYEIAREGVARLVSHLEKKLPTEVFLWQTLKPVSLAERKSVKALT
ncbi:MAG: LacI family DNA-binding transcriptional regulator [Candidatus Omnitrophica bacterium]|nr:LacI family DNA-binding transcriptional regulator [Candidatus Omnitrophota bacterium]